MSKGFSSSDPLDKLKKPVTEDTQKAVDGSEAKATKEKRNPGRPKTKTEETRTINIAVPVSILDKLDTVKVCYKNNLTQYINKLIVKDIEANYDNYKALADSLNNL